MVTYIKGYIGRDGYISAARPLKIGAAMPLYASGNAATVQGRGAPLAKAAAPLPYAAMPLATAASPLK